ncbi:MAG: hypothetical protein UU73_C0007G0016 [Candidatus Daviesbacteria bacterium GW2011_GWA1_41_61]|nr:MAG: hypothetical protein UU26_C0014G0006 [Candidatus Daviesbacteria bacterium GW2011_GWC1_40_9]KKR92750.1 MAG: hypothetical protein UU44_C0005G0080 [Candidatus Daviesbacteria bacterium GW2011_GWB1_41_15]KKS14509.1 MAG: hypothetical protein UU73_C0007G0016 [Candidatus Daviesbacteria bacterium GW2011_GWA1_41_61]
MDKKQVLKLKGKTAVFIDWANVYGWKKSLKKEVDPEKLFGYFKKYPQVEEINFYYGKDKHPKSKQFLKKMEEVGFRVISKEVKYIPVSLDSSHFRNIAKEVKTSLIATSTLKTEEVEQLLQILSKKILRRKCDFDIEIVMDVYRCLQTIDTYILFSGDGDFAPLYNLLIRLKKQVIIIFAHGHLGKEIYQIKQGIFTKAVDKLNMDLFRKNTPPVSRGA